MPNSAIVHPDQLQRIAQKLQQQQYSQAELLAAQLNERRPNHPDVLHLLALATKHRNASEAVRYFQQSLQVNPKQPDVLSNLGNLLQARRQFKDAKQCYQRALTLNEHSVDAWYNLASVHYRSRDYRAAALAAKKALLLQPNHLKAHLLTGRSELDYKRFDAAEATFCDALRRWPEEPNLRFHLALVYRYKEQTADARQLLDALKGHMDEAQRVFQLGCLAYDEGDYEQSESMLLESIERQNDLIPAHEALNKLYWESGDTARFLSSFQQAALRQPDSIALAYAYASHLFRDHRTEQASEVLKQYLNRFGEIHSLVHLRGVMAIQEGELAQGENLLRQALQQAPLYPRYLIDLAAVYLRQDEYAKADALLERARDNEPLNQEIYAYQGLSWRLSGQTEKAATFNDYDRYLKIGFLPTPEGYESLEQFWPLLEERVRELHNTRHQPLDQSVRGGTQTVGSLLQRDDPIIQSYRSSLEQYLREYLEQLPRDSNHPIVGRLTEQYHFSGSWSVKLFQNGFHSNHVHPEGWLSACTYLTVPEGVRRDDPQKKGWITFGETSLALPTDKIHQAVCPQPGMCVIFPSCFWHGTIPFDSNEERITLPCDIMPS